MPATGDSRIDGLTTSVAVKAPCKAVAIANVTPSGEQTVNGVACVTGDRVLVTAQTSSINNGIYVVSTGTWTRALDFDGTRDAVTGTIVIVANSSGTGPSYQLTTTDNPVVFGTSAITFVTTATLAALAASSGSSLVGWIYAAAGAVSATVLNWIRWQKINVFGFMTVAQIADVQSGALTLDVISPILAAKAAVQAAGGGALHFPKGTYLISAEIPIDFDGITITGDGPRTSVLQPNSQTANVLNFGNGTTIRNGITIKDIGFNTAVTKSAGSYIKLNKVNQVVLSNFWMGAPFIGLNITDSTIVMAELGQIVNPVATTGVGIYVGGTTGNDQYLRDIIVTGNVAAQCQAGVQVQQTTGLWLENVGAIWSGIGLQINPANGQTVYNLFTSRCAWDTNSAHGCLVQPAAGGSVQRWTSTGDWFSTNTLNGFVTGVTGTISGITLVAPRAYNNGQNGFAISSGSNYVISEPRISGNSTSAANTYDGIVVAANLNTFSVTSGRIGPVDGFSNAMRYGINILAGTSDFYNVTGVDVSGNGTGGISDNGSGTTKYIIGCNGYKTRNQGGASIGIGAATVVVNHGLSALPNINDIQLTPLNNLGASSIAYYWPSTVTSTQFTINVNANVAAVGINFAWSARISGA